MPCAVAVGACWVWFHRLGQDLGLVGTGKWGFGRGN